MDYALPSHNYHTTADFGGNDLFSQLQMPGTHDALSAAQNIGGESLGSESQVNQVVANLNAQNKQNLANAAAGQVPKVKRQDDQFWSGKNKSIFWTSENDSIRK